MQIPKAYPYLYTTTGDSSKVSQRPTKNIQAGSIFHCFLQTHKITVIRRIQAYIPTLKSIEITGIL